jgi:hypothetical protein
MGAVLITGSSCAGKSSLARVLTSRGRCAIDTDNDPRLTRWVDESGRAAECPDAPDLAWLTRHGWVWDPDRLDELIAASAAETVFLCGGAYNEADLMDRFERVFLLAIDEPTMLARLDSPGRDNEWGRVGDTRELLRQRLPGYQSNLRALGAIPVDATMPLDEVADAILAQVIRRGPSSR